jgi:hypothetical protein
MRFAPRFALVLALWLGPGADPARAADLVLLAGQADGFALPDEPAAPSAPLRSLAGVPQDFDLVAGRNGGLPDRQVCHTFTGLPPGISAATLTLRVRAGNEAGVSTDGILLSFVDASSSVYCGGAVAWSRSFGPTPGAGCFPVPDATGLAGSWSAGDTAFLVLDLSALPLAGGGDLDLLPSMNTHGFLDVNVSDETGCDFLILSLDTTATTPAREVAPRLELRAPFPNPFHETTTFHFARLLPAGTSLTIFDPAGRRVRELFDARLPAGRGAATWDGRDEGGGAPGVCFCTLRGGDARLSRRVVRVE